MKTKRAVSSLVVAKINTLLCECSSNNTAMQNCIDCPDLDFFDSGALDSLGAIKLIVGLQKILEVKVEPEDLANIRGQRDLLEYLNLAETRS